jgi:hypothetical protein
MSALGETSREGPLAIALTAVRAVAANPAVRRIELAWTTGIAGDAALLLAVLVVTYDRGGAAAVGLFSVIRMVPATIAGPIAATVATRYRMERVLLTIQSVRFVSAATVAILLASGAAYQLTWIPTILAAFVGTMVRPIQTSALPSLASTPDQLVATNAASSTGEGLGALVGPLAAGAALAVAGPAAAAAVAVALFAFASAAMLGVRRIETEGPAAGDGVGLAAALAPVVNGFRVLAAHPGPAVIIADFAMQSFVRGLLVVLIVASAIDLLGMGDPGVGVLNGALGAGGLLGAVAAISLAGRTRLGGAFAVSLTMWGLPIALIAVWPVPLVAIAALAAVGLANAILDVVGFTLVQRGIRTQDRVAVFGVLEAAAAVGVGLGGLVAPVLIDAFDIRGALAVSGAILPILAVATWPRVQRADDEFVVPARQLALLRGIPLFAPLTLSAIERVASAMRPATFAAGETIMREGEIGDRYVVVDDGTAEVTMAGRPINRLGPGDGFGEIALIQAVPRTATVTAETPIVAYELDRSDFLEAIANPGSAAAAAAISAERLARGGRLGGPEAA